MIKDQSITVSRKANIYWLIFFLNLFVCHTSIGDNLFLISGYHGTMITIYFERGYIVIGAESRSINAQNTNETREECKIMELGPHAFFSQVGINSIADLVTGQPIFDGKVIASKIFAEGMQLEESASAWTNAMESEYSKFLLSAPDDPVWRHDRVMAVGIFGGMNEGELVLIKIVIEFHASTHGFTREISKLPPDKGRWRTFGATSKVEPFVNDFLKPSSDAAKIAKHSYQQYIIDNGLDEVEAHAKEAQNLIEFVISASAGTIPEIGGGVSVVIAEKGKAVRWSARSPACAR